jgi:hypothetical protein
MFSIMDQHISVCITKMQLSWEAHCTEIEEDIMRENVMLLAEGYTQFVKLFLPSFNETFSLSLALSLTIYIFFVRKEENHFSRTIKVKLYNIQKSRERCLCKSLKCAML